MKSTVHLHEHQFKPMERAAAKLAGETTYFTGRPCRHGHIDYRCTANGQCVICSRKMQSAAAKKRFLQNPNIYKENYAKNPEKYRIAAAKYREKYPEKIKENNKKSIQTRKAQRSADQMKRHAAKLKATPKWLSDEDLILMKKYYIASHDVEANNGIVLSVDHIVPLRGKEVCGLNVPWNLCLRTKADNSRKHNKLTEDAYLPKQTGILVCESALPWNLRKEN